MTMNVELMEALGQIAREKSVDRQVLIETLTAGLVSAAKKKLGANADVHVDFDEESGKIRMFANFSVVDDFDLADRGTQIPRSEAARIRADARVGDVLTVDLPIAEFGRNAIAAAKQVLIQRVREAERDRVYDDFRRSRWRARHAASCSRWTAATSSSSSTAPRACCRRASRSAAIAIARAST